MNNKKLSLNNLAKTSQKKLIRLTLTPLVFGISLCFIQNTALAGDDGIVGPSMIQYDHNAKNLDNTISPGAQRTLQQKQLQKPLAPQTSPYSTTKGDSKTSPAGINKKSSTSTKDSSPYQTKNRNYTPGTPLGTTGIKKQPSYKNTAPQKKALPARPGSYKVSPYQQQPTDEYSKGTNNKKSGDDKFSKGTSKQPIPLNNSTVRKLNTPTLSPYQQSQTGSPTKGQHIPKLQLNSGTVQKLNRPDKSTYQRSQAQGLSRATQFFQPIIQSIAAPEIYSVKGLEGTKSDRVELRYSYSLEVKNTGTTAGKYKFITKIPNAPLHTSSVFDLPSGNESSQHTIRIKTDLPKRAIYGYDIRVIVQLVNIENNRITAEKDIFLNQNSLRSQYTSWEIEHNQKPIRDLQTSRVLGARVSGNNTTIRVRVRNSGTQTWAYRGKIHVSIFEGREDSPSQKFLRVKTIDIIPPIEARNSHKEYQATFPMSLPTGYYYTVKMRIESENDMDPTNNIQELSFILGEDGTHNWR